MMTVRIKEIELPRFETELIAVGVIFQDDESATVASAEVVVLLSKEDMSLSEITEKAIGEAKRFLLKCEDAEPSNIPLANGGAHRLDDHLG